LSAEEPHELDAPLTIAGRVVARMRIPVSLLFEIIRRLNEEMTRYERTFGEIRPPGS
jgi:hypothetical protein